MCLRAFTGKNYHVVISIGNNLDSHAYDDFPENFTVKQSVPQQKLLEAVDLFEIAANLISDPKYINAAEKYKSIFSEEEKVSHIKAADVILNYISMAPQ